MAASKDINEIINELKPTLTALNRSMNSLNNKVVDSYSAVNNFVKSVNSAIADLKNSTGKITIESNKQDTSGFAQLAFDPIINVFNQLKSTLLDLQKDLKDLGLAAAKSADQQSSYKSSKQIEQARLSDLESQYNEQLNKITGAKNGIIPAPPDPTEGFEQAAAFRKLEQEIANLDKAYHNAIKTGKKNIYEEVKATEQATNKKKSLFQGLMDYFKPTKADYKASVQSDIEQEKFGKERSKGFFESVFKNPALGSMAATATQYGTTKTGQSVHKQGFTPADFTKSFKQIGATFDGLMSSMKMLSEQFKKLAFLSAIFVKAFSPAYVEMFMYALQDLSAVIGSALMPILQAFTNVVKYAGDMLLPLVEQLAPSFALLGEMIIGFLVPIIQGLVNLFSSLSEQLNNGLMPALLDLISSFGSFIGEIIEQLGPTISFLLNILSAMAQILTPIIQLLEYLAPAFADIIGVLLGAGLIAALVALASALAPFLTVTNLVIAALSLLAGWVIRFAKWLFGWQQKQETYQANRSAGLAARAAQYTTAEDISKNLIKAAFGGQNADRLKNIDQNGRRQVELLEKIAGKKQVVVAGNNNNRGLAVA